MTTIFLRKLIGLYLVAISIGMLANRRRTLAALDEMARSGPWLQFSGGHVDPVFVVVVAPPPFDIFAHVLAVEPQRALFADFEANRAELGAVIAVQFGLVSLRHEPCLLQREPIPTAATPQNQHA